MVLCTEVWCGGQERFSARMRKDALSAGSAIRRRPPPSWTCFACAASARDPPPWWCRHLSPPLRGKHLPTALHSCSPDRQSAQTPVLSFRFVVCCTGISRNSWRPVRFPSHPMVCLRGTKVHSNSPEWQPASSVLCAGTRQTCVPAACLCVPGRIAFCLVNKYM